MIKFNIPYLSDLDIDSFKNFIASRNFSGDGIYTDLTSKFISKYLNAGETLLTHSCTAALEMAALLIDFKKNDEIIMPSFTFVSSANAFVLFGGKPVFVDIKEETLNINEDLIESAITKNTKAILVVHYAGVSCNMNKILDIANRYGLILIEDAAQAIGSSFLNKKLGSFGDFSTFSFHETKNINCGEGGALVINNSDYVERAKIIREKGTNRSNFLAGYVDKYTWVDKGSSYLPSELTAFLLYSQINHIDEVSKKRSIIWNNYYSRLKILLSLGIKFANIPDYCEHNSHIFYFITRSKAERDSLLNFLKKNGILATFHYVPLHSSPAGKLFCRNFGDLHVTETLPEKLVRLPIYPDLSKCDAEKIIEKVLNFYGF